MRYIQRYNKGKLSYLAKFNGVLFARILENNTFIGGWDVLKCGSNKPVHFSSIEAAQNFCETSANIRGLK